MPDVNVSPSAAADRQPPQPNGLAIASIVFGVLNFICLPIVGGLVGAVLGHLAMARGRTPGVGGRGLALAGVIVGYAGAAVMVVPLLLAGLVFLQMTKQGRTRVNIQEREQRYSQISMETLGRYVGKAWPGKQIVIVDFAPGSALVSAERHQMLVNALEDGLAGKARIVGDVKVGEQEMKKASSNAGAMPMDMMIGQEIFTAKTFDRIVADTPADIIVSFIGLPMDYQALKYWKLPQDKQPVLVLTQLPDLTDPALQAAIAADGQIGAVLTGNPIIGAPMPEDPTAAFNSRYLLITRENIRDLIQDYPMLFGGRR